MEVRVYSRAKELEGGWPERKWRQWRRYPAGVGEEGPTRFLGDGSFQLVEGYPSLGARTHRDAYGVGRSPLRRPEWRGAWAARPWLSMELESWSSVKRKNEERRSRASPVSVA